MVNLNWFKILSKSVIACLLVIGLNQNLLFQLATSEAKAAPETPEAACACAPTSCMCPPSDGCEHNRPGEKDHKEKNQISICRLNACNQGIAYYSSGDREIPILTHHIAGRMPYPSIVSHKILPDDFAAQQYLTPPDKPPQSIHS